MGPHSRDRVISDTPAFVGLGRAMSMGMFAKINEIPRDCLSITEHATVQERTADLNVSPIFHGDHNAAPLRSFPLNNVNILAEAILGKPSTLYVAYSLLYIRCHWVGCRK